MKPAQANGSVMESVFRQLEASTRARSRAKLAHPYMWAGASSGDSLGFPSDRGSTPMGHPFGFGGQWGGYTDAATGLTLLTHRFYDPVTGRFMTRDPMGYEGGINLYAYTQNDPVNYVDPEGTSKSLSGMSCPELGAYISSLESKILNEEQKYKGDGDTGGFPHRYGTTVFAGHWIEIINLQRALGRALAEYANRCGTNLPVPQACWKYYPYPNPKGKPTQFDQPIQDITGPTLLPIFAPWSKIGDILGGLVGAFGGEVGGAGAGAGSGALSPGF